MRYSYNSLCWKLRLNIQIECSMFNVQCSHITIKTLTYDICSNELPHAVVTTIFTVV